MKYPKTHKLLQEYADFTCTNIDAAYFPAESPLYGVMREGVTIGRSKELKRIQHDMIMVENIDTKELEERKIMYWRNVWALNHKQKRTSGSRVPRIVHKIKTPLTYEAINQIMFEAPATIYTIVFMKYFVTSLNGEKMKDKRRYQLMNLSPHEFIWTVDIAHLWIMHNLPNFKRKLCITKKNLYNKNDSFIYPATQAS